MEILWAVEKTLLKMEKSNSTATQTAEPPIGAQDLVFTPAAVARPQLGAQVPAPPSRGRKRALEGNLQIENSNYYKMRLLLKDVRPHVLEVLRTRDLSNCKAAIEIEEKMKHMLQLYQEMIGETPKREKTTKSDNGKPINRTTEPSSSEASYVQTDKHNSDGDGGDKLVGGSPFGWNFVTYGGSEAVYCGLSKEEYRTSHPIIQAEAEQKPELHNAL